MIRKKRTIKRKYPVIPTPYFRGKSQSLSKVEFMNVKKCLRDLSSTRTKKTIGVKSCGNIRVIYRVSNKKIYPLTLVRKRKKR